MKKWIKWLIVIIIIAIILLAVMVLFKQKGTKNAEGDKKLITATVQLGDIKTNATGTGTLMPQNVQMPDYDQLELVTQMDELDIPDVKENQHVRITVAAFPGKTYTGKVKSIAKQGEVQNGVSSFKVVISLDNQAHLKAGMTADASILVHENKKAIYVPVEAVQKDDNDKYYVLLADKDKQGQTKKTKKFVTTGLHNENNIEIKRGVKAGEKVILPTKKTENNSNF